MPRPERAVEGNGPLADFARQLREARSQAGGMTYRELAAASGFSPSALASAASGSSLPTWKVAKAYLSGCGIVQPELDEWRARWERARDSRAAPDTGSPADDDLAAPRPDDRAKPARVLTQNDFGHELTALRVRAGLTVRKVARAAGMPVSTVGDYFAGRHLPADDQQLRKLLEACGETGRDQITQWTDALHRTRRSGRIRNALARTAEETYDSLDDGQRKLAQRLFLHFVRMTDDTPSTRAMDLAKLCKLRDSHPATDVLTAFVDARLVTVDAQKAWITHDTLIHAWPRLQGWVDDNASLLRTIGQLDQSSSAWVNDGRDSAHLYQGSRLAAALETLNDQKDLLTTVNCEFLDESQQLKQRQQCKPQATDTKNMLCIVALVVPVLVPVLVFGAWRVNAITHKWDTALRNQSATLSEQLAYASRTISDPAAAALMAANAWRIAPTGQAGSSLVTAFARQAVTSMRLPVGRGEAIDPAVAFSPDGTTLATSTHNGTIQLWNTATRHLTTTLHTGNNTPATAITFSPDDTTLATSTHNGTIQLWNTATRHPIPLPFARHTGVVYSMAFSPNSRILATGYDKGRVQLWDMVTRRPVGSLQSGDTTPVLSIAFSPDGMTLAASNSQKMVRVWDLATGRQEGSFQTGIRRESPFLPDTGFTEIDYSPAGGLLVTVGANGTVQFWNETTLHEIGTPMTTGGISDAVFSPDGRILATVEGGEHPVVYLWTLPTTTSANQLSDVICARAEHVLVGTGVPHPSPCPT